MRVRCVRARAREEAGRTGRVAPPCCGREGYGTAKSRVCVRPAESARAVMTHRAHASTRPNSHAGTSGRVSERWIFQEKTGLRNAIMLCSSVMTKRRAPGNKSTGTTGYKRGISRRLDAPSTAAKAPRKTVCTPVGTPDRTRRASSCPPLTSPRAGRCEASDFCEQRTRFSRA